MGSEREKLGLHWSCGLAIPGRGSPEQRPSVDAPILHPPPDPKFPLISSLGRTFFKILLFKIPFESTGVSA